MENGNLTTVLMWRVALVAAFIDTPLLALVAWRVSSELFGRLKWFLVGAAALVFAIIWGTVGSVIFWDSVYKAIFPAWWRWLLPVIYGCLFGALALAFWRLSMFAKKLRVVWFVLLGGAVSLVGHLIGASRGLFRVPLLAQTSIPSALVFGVFEFIFYWCAITGLAVLGKWLRTYPKHKEEPDF
jgi:hypothetical protein